VCKKGSGHGKQGHHIKEDKEAKVVTRLDIRTHDPFCERKT